MSPGQEKRLQITAFKIICLLKSAGRCSQSDLAQAKRKKKILLLELVGLFQDYEAKI